MLEHALAQSRLPILGDSCSNQRRKEIMTKDSCWETHGQTTPNHLSVAESFLFSLDSHISWRRVTRSAQVIQETKRPLCMTWWLWIRSHQMLWNSSVRRQRGGRDNPPQCSLFSAVMRAFESLYRGTKSWSHCSVQKPKLVHGNPHFALYSVLDMTEVTETHEDFN